MNLKTLFAPVLVFLLLGLSACGSGEDGTASTNAETTTSTPSESSGNEPAPSGEAVRAARVEIAGFAYDPDPVTVQVGGKVIWLNQDSAPHTATAEDGSFDTGALAEGKLKSETFKQPGTYAYFCEIHPSMHGSVEVVEKG